MSKSISKKPAKSNGNISYSEPVLLHESSKTRITFVPFYIHRSKGDELAGKIQSYKKSAPPMDWILADDKSISFREGAIRKLLDALKSHLSIVDEDDGSFLLIKVNEQVADFSNHDPEKVANALTSILSQEEILSHINIENFTDELANAFKGAIKLREMQSAVSTLRNHLENGEVLEKVYQEWCNNCPWAFGNSYVLNQDDTTNIGTQDKLDIILSNVIAGYRDIIELKRPDMSVLNYDSSHNNYYFSSDLAKAIGQCHRYLDVLHESASRGLRDYPEMVAYHPRATIVIGRSNDWSDDKHRALHGLNSRMNNITIMTYDHLLNQGERLVSMLSTESPANQSEEDLSATYDFDPDIDF